MVTIDGSTRVCPFDGQPTWKRRALQCATQSPLLKTRASIAGISKMHAEPRAVIIGIGLSSRHTLSIGLPFDVLGLLLAAEQLRRATGAARLVALIADRHALTNGFCAQRIEVRARDAQRSLSAVRDALALPLDVVRAETLHHTREYRAIVREVERTAEVSAHPYVKLEVADTEYLRRTHRAILKLGWAVDAGTGAAADVLDERYFDGRFARWIGADVGFAYTCAGRTLDPRRPLAAPYLAFDSAHRLLLAPDELAGGKIEQFLAHGSRPARCALKGHLRRITSVYSRAITPLTGLVHERVRSVLQHVFHPHAAPAGALRRA